jgi:4-hydroxy-tetrahydrodipicolinate synthase
MFNGIFTAIVTPFLNNKLDLSAFNLLLKEQKENGISGVVISGTTGESPNLTRKEKEILVKEAQKFRDDNFKIILGTGSNSTNNTIEETKYFQESGIDGVLLVTPYYNKPTQDGLYNHYKEIHNNTNVPIILYNVPGRTSVSLSLDTIIKLSALDRIVSIKEATANMLFGAEIRIALPKISLLSGDDGSFLPFLAIGGDGSISVVSNVAPKLVVDIYQLFKNNKNKEAMELNTLLVELTKAMFLETNPIPVKTALVELNKISEEFRLPLTKMGEMNRRMLRMTLRRIGLF